MKPKSLRAATCAVLAAWVAAAPVWATCGGGGGGGLGGIVPPGADASSVYYVPWQIVGEGSAAPEGSSMVIYWFPRSADDARTSELTSSRVLTNYSAQCVAMALVRSQDRERHPQYDVADNAEAVVVVSGGEIVERIERESEDITIEEVEASVTAAVQHRAQELDAKLEEAKNSVEKGEKEKAIELYSSVADERCLYPKPARKARKALEKLGVPVANDLPNEALPVLDAETSGRMVAMMSEGLEAEREGDYERAEHLYTRAHELDPGDSVPLRFLGELERHHTGDWDRARELFEGILEMRSDPISRAVALHGLGKMTIHDGDFEKGLSMFERSVEAYPLALTYRNMAVYWNSEGEKEKAMTYVRRAIALDPEDPYNIVFAATYLAEDGRTDEAIAIAAEHEELLPASYNLAAIYALSGETARALALLRRHFYEYEQYDDVRRREMWEARADIVFASLMDDPGFRELTRLAD